MKQVTEFWTPIFSRGGNLIAFTSSAFVAESEHEAQNLGAIMGPGVEAVTGAEYTGEALRVDNGQAYIPGMLSGQAIAILSGPVFTRAVGKQVASGRVGVAA